MSQSAPAKLVLSPPCLAPMFRDFAQSTPGWPEVVAREECLHQRVEPFGIFDEAAMAGAGQDLVLGVRDQRRGSHAAWERVVVLAVDDQSRAPVGGKFGRQVRYRRAGRPSRIGWNQGQAGTAMIGNSRL